MDTILKFENFGFKYDAQTSPTLYDINFSVKKGEKVLIAGPSGCGKSTLVHCINGLVPFSYKGKITGSLSLFGRETRDMSLFEISKHVGTVLQDSDAQFVGLTVAEDIAFALENDCVVCSRYFANLLRKNGIEDFEHFAFTEEEQLLIDYGRAMAKDPKRIPDALFEKLKAVFSEETLVVATAMGVFMIANNVFNDALQVEPEGRS